MLILIVFTAYGAEGQVFFNTQTLLLLLLPLQLSFHSVAVVLTLVQCFTQNLSALSYKF
jgi:hypothetical protein